MNAQECGFEAPQNYEMYDSNPNALPSTSPPNYCINVVFRIIRNNDESEGYDPNNIPQILPN